MHYLYILFSPKANNYYVGETNDMIRRMDQHISGFFKGSFTAKAKDWELKLCIEFDDICKARKAEVFLKRMKSRKFIEKLILDSEWFRIKFNS